MMICPIWKKECPDKVDINFRPRGYRAGDEKICSMPSGNSPVCKCLRAGGKVKFKGANPLRQLRSLTAALSEDAKVRLCGWIARENVVHGNIPVVDRDSVNRFKSGHLPTMLERLDLALEWLVIESGGRFGSTPFTAKNRGTILNEKIYSFMAFSYSHEHEDDLRGEFAHILRYLGDKVKNQYGPGGDKGGKDLGVSVTPAGFAHYEELQKTIDSSQAFIAMWFHKSMDPLREAIEAAVRAAGYEPKCVDTAPEIIGRIEDEIIALIRQSRFVVADFTANPDPIESKEQANPRGGVYYEAGFAHGLNRPVFFTCREDYIKVPNALHFDTSHFLHIDWKDGDLGEGGKFRKELQKRIEASVGKGPKSPPNSAPA